MKIEFVIIHCSDTPASADIGVSEIRRNHTAPVDKGGRGWSDIGYQEVVRLSGIVELGRYHDGDQFLTGKEIGAHTLGKNAASIGICWIGGKNGDQPRAEQYKSLIGRIVYNCIVHRISPDQVLGHSEADPGSGKTCPNLNMARVRLDVREELKARGF